MSVKLLEAKILTIKIVSFLFFASICMSCKKDKLKGDKEILIGKWNWQYTQYKYDLCQQNGGYEAILNPLTEAANYQLEFFENGWIKFYKNAILVDEKRIVFHNFYEVNSGDEDYIFHIYMDNDEDQRLLGSIYKSNLDCLYTWDYPIKTINSPCDEYKNYFIRE